jgi:hypothetical protein
MRCERVCAEDHIHAMDVHVCGWVGVVTRYVYKACAHTRTYTHPPIRSHTHSWLAFFPTHKVAKVTTPSIHIHTHTIHCALDALILTVVKINKGS